jgi:hypothetical protein
VLPLRYKYYAHVAAKNTSASLCAAQLMKSYVYRLSPLLLLLQVEGAAAAAAAAAGTASLFPAPPEFLRRLELRKELTLLQFSLCAVQIIFRSTNPRGTTTASVSSVQRRLKTCKASYNAQ